MGNLSEKIFLKDFEKLQNNLVEFLKNYLKNSNSNGFIVGLSGGLDSVIVAKLCSLADKTKAILLPTKSSNPLNLNHAKKFCNEIKLDYETLYLDEILSQFANQTQLSFQNTQDRLRLGNITARARMILLYDFSAKYNYIVVGTSNKSERMIGYGTIYGDLAYACNPIGELYKSELFEFAKFLKIDDEIISKPPSADLWEDQSDEKDLGFSYFDIDRVLFALENGQNLSKFNENLVKMVQTRVAKNSFKLKMPSIAKV